MTRKKLATAQNRPSGLFRTAMELAGFACFFTSLMLQFRQNDLSIKGLVTLCIGVLFYSLPRISFKSELQFSNGGKSSWHKASLADYQNFIKHLRKTAHRTLPITFGLSLFYCAAFGIFAYGDSEMPELKHIFLVIIDILALAYVFLYYKLPQPSPQMIAQKLSAFETITGFNYPEDFKLHIQFQMKKLQDSHHLVPYDMRFSIDYRLKSPEWFSLDLVVLLKPEPFFCYAVFVATKPSPVFSAFETIALPKNWKRKAKLEKAYPSLAMTFSTATNTRDIDRLLKALIKGINSDAFQTVLKSKVKTSNRAKRIIENPSVANKS